MLWVIPFSLGACATTKEPGVEIRTVTVEVPIEKPCPGAVPTRPAKLDPLPDSPISALAMVMAKLGEFSLPGKYADQAESYFRSCPPSEPTTPH